MQNYCNVKMLQGFNTSYFILYVQPLKMELIEGSETSANHNRTPGKYPKNTYNLTRSVKILLGRDSVVGTASMLRSGRSGDRFPMGARFSAPVHADPGAHPASYTMGAVSFSGLKRPGRGVDHPPHLVPKLMKEYSCISGAWR